MLLGATAEKASSGPFASSSLVIHLQAVMAQLLFTNEVLPFFAVLVSELETPL